MLMRNSRNRFLIVYYRTTFFMFNIQYPIFTVVEKLQTKSYRKGSLFPLLIETSQKQQLLCIKLCGKNQSSLQAQAHSMYLQKRR